MNIIKSIFGKWYIVVACIGAAIALGVLTQNERYESEASLIFKVGREYLYQPEFGDRKPIASSRTDLQSAINAESHIMGSTEVLAAALRQVGVERFLGPASDANSTGTAVREQQAVDVLSSDLSIRSIDGTTVVRVSLQHADPAVARDSLQAVLDAFLERRKEIYRDSSLDLMQRKLAESKTALHQAETDLKAFMNERNIYSFEEQINSLTQQRIRTDETLQDLAAQMNELELRLKLTRERTASVPQSISLYTDTSSNSVYEDAKNQLFKLQLERNRTKGKYREDSTVVQQLKNEIAELERFIAEQSEFTTSSVRKGRNPAYDELVSQQIELESRLGSTVGRIEALRELSASLQQQRAELDDIRIEYESLQANVGFLRDRQLAYAEEVEKAQLASDVEDSVRSSARVLQIPTLPGSPYGITGGERIKISALLGLLGGVALLLGLAVLTALTRSPTPEPLLLTDDSVKEPAPTVNQPRPKHDDAEADSAANEIHGIPVLGKIRAS